MDPGPSLRELEAQVLAQSPDLLVGAGPGPVAPRHPDGSASGTELPPGGPASARASGPGGALLDRGCELARLTAGLARATSGDGGLLLIEGPAGIGKTRLLAELRRRAAADGVQVLTARGSDLERQFAYGVVRQLFEPQLRDDAACRALLAGAAESARAVFASSQIVHADRADGSFSPPAPSRPSWTRSARDRDRG